MRATRNFRNGTVYLIHFERPFHHAKHYIGYADNVFKRMREHAASKGANLLRVLNEQGIKWHVVRTWAGDRKLERKLKNRGGAARICPVCQQKH